MPFSGDCDGDMFMLATITLKIKKQIVGQIEIDTEGQHVSYINVYHVHNRKCHILKFHRPTNMYIYTIYYTYEYI